MNNKFMVGFWREFYNIDGFSSIFNDIKETKTYSNKAAILKYLEEGCPLVGSRGFIRCPITNDLMNPPEVLTDGTWIWTSELIYYFDTYNIIFNSQFIKFIENKNYLFTKPKKKELTIIHKEIISRLFPGL